MNVENTKVVLIIMCHKLKIILFAAAAAAVAYKKTRWGQYETTHQANIYIKQKMSVQGVQEQKQETNRKQEVCAPIATTKPEVTSHNRGGQAACEMLRTQLTSEFPLCETVNTVTVHCRTQSCCFINNATPQT